MPASSALLLKSQIEAQLAHRIPAALSPMARQQTERQPLLDPHLTGLLGGGIPVGAITEILGQACSGRTSVALSVAAAVTVAERVVAWVDVSDELDPETAALCGVNLDRLLWIRCGKPSSLAIKSPASSQAGGTRIAAAPAGAEAPWSTPGSDAAATTSPNLVSANHTPRPVGNGGCGSPHPRAEGRGMAEAIDSLLQQQPRSAAIPDRRARKKIGTPGMPNRDVTHATSPGSVSHHVATVLGKAAQFPSGRTAAAKPSNLTPPEEIVPTHGSLFGRQVERKSSSSFNRTASPIVPPQRPPMPFPNASPYREEQVPTDRQPSRRAHAPAEKPRAALRGLDTPVVSRTASSDENMWAPLDQALRSVDLLLQAGGFSLLVLDLSSVPADKVWRIPLATWFRFRAGCERSRGSLVVLAQHSCARASADLSAVLRRTALHIDGERVITGGSIAVELEQQRRGAGTTRDSGHFAEKSNVVPIRKAVRSDRGHAPDLTWRAGTAWSVRA